MYRYIMAAFAIIDSELSDERAWQSYSLPSFPGDHHMAFCLFASIARHPGFYGYQAALAATLAVVWANPLPAKDVSLTAIELYSGASGPAYVHITDVLINGKIELRSCSSATKIDKSTYGKLAKVILGPGASLEYGNDGVLILTRDASSSCVVPSNLKFEKNAPVTPAELASKAILQGKVLSTGTDANEAPPPLKPGVKIVFVTAPDVELAEFLRAERASTIPLWQDYLGRYPSSPHSLTGKQSLTALLVKEGASSLEAYRKSLSGASKSFDDLKKARARATQALAVLPTYVIAGKLDDDVKTELIKLVSEGQKELQDYSQALKSQTPGYAHLTAASKLADTLFEIDPHFAPGVALQSETNSETTGVESKLKSGESSVAAKRFDDGYAAIAPFSSFFEEVPRVGAVVKAAYDFHFGHGEELAGAKDWEGAVKEFQKASEISQTQRVAASLKNAKAELGVMRDKRASNAALQQSQALSAQGQYIQAYEVLSSLPPAQHSMVADELQRLGPLYVQAASDTAKDLQQAHDPIRGLKDELEIERAYGYLHQANALGNDPKLKDRMDDLADKLSDYYLQQAKRYMEKPLGSGAGLGWSYLDKALAYQASNLSAVRDERTRAASAYQMRSRLSIRVVFRDQTSRRDSAGFAYQLADAMATGLETSGLPVRVIRPGESPAFEPNFQLVGDVIQHRRTSVPTSKPKDSKYRAGEQEMPNDNWNKANREYESATLDLQRTQVSLQGATSHGKKKEIADANNLVSAAQRKVEEARAKLDTIPKTIPIDIVKPYTYTEKDIDLTAAVQLQFRINDSSGNQLEPPVPISKDANQKFVVLENVKPEDTEGVKAQGTIPDEIQFLTDVENIARDLLLKAVRESVAKFPEKIFEQAKKRADGGDLDGAAESYILYLNSTPGEQTSKRELAERFLREQYNVRRALSSGS